MPWPEACSTASWTDHPRSGADWRNFQRQMSAASCLLLVLASINYWQIKEIERVIGKASEENLALLQLDLLSHVSPIGWENVMLYGQYVLRRELVMRSPRDTTR